MQKSIPDLMSDLLNEDLYRSLTAEEASAKKERIEEDIVQQLYDDPQNLFDSFDDIIKKLLDGNKQAGQNILGQVKVETLFESLKEKMGVSVDFQNPRIIIAKQNIMNVLREIAKNPHTAKHQIQEKREKLMGDKLSAIHAVDFFLRFNLDELKEIKNLMEQITTKMNEGPQKQNWLKAACDFLMLANLYNGVKALLGNKSSVNHDVTTQQLSQDLATLRSSRPEKLQKAIIAESQAKVKEMQAEKSTREIS